MTAVLIYAIVGELWWLFLYGCGVAHACARRGRSNGMSERHIAFALILSVVTTLVIWPFMLATYAVRGPPPTKWE